VQQIEDWRSKQRPIPSQNEAINKFIQQGIETLKEEVKAQ